MGDRFRMVLRRRSGSLATTSSLRARRTVVPPKNDDLSVLTWKEQQMIEKAQLASLKMSSQKRVYAKRGRPKKNQVRRENPYNSSSSEEEEDNTNDATSSDCLSSPPPLSPITVITSAGKPSKPGKGGCKAGKSGKKRRSSVGRSPSGQSLGSMGSFPELLSPCFSRTATSGGFAARKSAYMGTMGSSGDEDDDEYATRRRLPLSNSNFHHGQNSSDEEDGSGGSRRKLPPAESMPTTEDFISYLVLKGINCVPEELEYIGSLQWETVPLKRKTHNSGAKKMNDSASSTKISVPPVAVVRPEQAWAKKAIERAKKSLVVKNSEQQRSAAKASVKTKNSKPSAASGCAKMTSAPVEKPRSSTNWKSASKRCRKETKRSPGARTSKQRGTSTRIKSPVSKRICQGCSKASCR